MFQENRAKLSDQLEIELICGAVFRVTLYQYTQRFTVIDASDDLHSVLTSEQRPNKVGRLQSSLQPRESAFELISM